MPNDQQHSNIFQVVFALFALVVVFLLYAFLYTNFYRILPTPPGQTNHIYDPERSIYSIFFGIFDNSFLFIFVIALLMDVVASYLFPSVQKGIVNLVLLFSSSYFVAQINGIVPVLNQVLAFSSTFPNTYNVLSTNYYAVIMLFMLGLSTIFSFRQKRR